MGISHPSKALSLVDECARVIKEQGLLAYTLRPTVRLPGIPPGTIPAPLLTKLLCNLSAQRLRRFEFANPRVDTDAYWKGLCKRDFAAESSTPDSGWKTHYKFLVCESRQRETRIKRSFQDGVSFVRQRAEARKAQPTPPSAIAVCEAAPTMPRLQRRSGMPLVSGGSAFCPRPQGLARMISSKSYAKKDALRMAASAAQSQLRRHHVRMEEASAANGNGAKRPRNA